MLYGVQGGVDAGSRTLKSMIRKEPIVVQRHRVIKGREYTDWMSYCGSLPGHKFRFCAQTRTGALEKANAFLMRYRLGDGLFEGRLSGRRLWWREATAAAGTSYASATWDLRDAAGRPLEPGIYLYRGVCGTGVDEKESDAEKLVIVRP